MRTFSIGENTVNSAESEGSGAYPPHYLSVPIDHFHNDSRYEPHRNDKFPLRYWFDASHYQEGGAVVILEGGETSGEGIHVPDINIRALQPD